MEFSGDFQEILSLAWPTLKSAGFRQEMIDFGIAQPDEPIGFLLKCVSYRPGRDSELQRRSRSRIRLTVKPLFEVVA